MLMPSSVEGLMTDFEVGTFAERCCRLPEINMQQGGGLRDFEAPLGVGNENLFTSALVYLAYLNLGLQPIQIIRGCLPIFKIFSTAFPKL